MRIHLLNSESLEFVCKEDLSKVIPASMFGRAINYGQGEGQVQIQNTVWGFYILDDDNYSMILEEGVLEFSSFVDIVSGIVSSIKTNFNLSVVAAISGSIKNP